MTEPAKHIGFQTSKQKEEAEAVPDKKKKVNPELIEAMEMVMQHFQPCEESAANAYKSTDDFIAQTGLWLNGEDVANFLKEKGYLKTFIPNDGIKWCVFINE